MSRHTTAYPRPEYSGQEQLYANPTQKVVEQQVRSPVALDSGWKAHADQLCVQIEFAVTLLFIALIGLVKCSLLFFFSRVFCPHGTGTFFITTRIAVCACALWSLSFFVSFFFVCGVPLSHEWAPLILWGKVCHSLPWEEAFAISDFMIDLGIFVMPLPMVRTETRRMLSYSSEANTWQIWKLRMSWKRKVGVSFLMAIGTMWVFHFSGWPQR